MLDTGLSVTVPLVLIWGALEASGTVNYGVNPVLSLDGFA
jgi:hypothetical protein